jgi:predicted RNase H-like nuclease (RuvC/YqgF family)
MRSDMNQVAATPQTPIANTKTSKTEPDEGSTTMQTHDAWFHLSEQIGHVLENQRKDGERLTRLEETTKHMRADIISVKRNQESCPGRIEEMKRQVRIEAWKVRGKIFMWVLGATGATVGVVKAFAHLFGG